MGIQWVDKTFEQAMDDLVKDMGAGVRTAVRSAATSLHDELRRQVDAAGLGDGLAAAWQVYLYGVHTSLNPAALIYSKATLLHDAFNTSVTITARNARWLVIPLPAATALGFQLRPQGRRGRQLSPPLPAKWSNVDAAQAKWGALEFRPLHGGNKALLVAPASQAGGRSPGSAARKGVPVFLLLRNVKLGKRLDVEGALAHAREQLYSAVMASLPSA
ncbi:DUF6441 family protein [Nitrospirillum iridis]|uniref:Uncharacterized protein n=1 Tax=Nitrospirillum iridis TaxID=765888 RepID=A0A7X0AY38_9PROT|nr:DUF6441 family protein [Nitrospirillum iridis]MBB6251441.1 hypothetical protein [Nitrospirillum iridis]